MSLQNSGIGEVFRRELERIRRNPADRFLLFLGPMTGILLLFFIFRQGQVTGIPIAVVDQDGSSLSIRISNALGAAQEVDVIAHYPSVQYACKAMLRGQIEGFVVLPEGLEGQVFTGSDAPVPVYINGTNVLKSGLIQRSVLTTLKTISGGIQLHKLQLEGMNGEQAMARVVPVDLEKHILFNPYTSYNYFLNSAMLYIMLFLFVFLSSIYTLGNELKRGTGPQLLSAGHGSVGVAVAAKLLPYTLVFFGFAVLIDLLLFGLGGMPLRGSFGAIFLGQFLVVITYQLLALLFVGLTSNLRLALSIGSAYSMMAITFSGLTFPLEGMPLIAKGFAAIFPFTWWEKLLQSQALRGAPLKDTLPFMGIMLIFIAVSLCFLPVYKRHLQDPKYWMKS